MYKKQMYVQAPKSGRKKNFFRQTGSSKYEPLDDDESVVEPKSITNAKSMDGNKQQQLEENKKRIRRGGKKHKSKFQTYFTLFGNNTAGLKNKKDSLEANIEIFKKPSCITLQETKLPKNTNFHLDDYQIFQKN